MKTKKHYFHLGVLLLVSLLLMSSCSKIETAQTPSIQKVPDPISLQSNEKVINTYFKEVIKKEEINRIDLVAKKEKAPFYYDLTLIIDGIRYSLDTTMKGYQPELLLTDLDNDGLADLIIKVKSGYTDNSLFFELYHFQNREIKSLLQKNQKNGIVPLQISWFSDNTLQIRSQPYKINCKKTLHLTSNFNQSSKVGLSNYQVFDVKDVDKDGQSELITEQSMWLQYSYQTIFRFHAILKYSHDQWTLLEYRFIPIDFYLPDTLP